MPGGSFNLEWAFRFDFFVKPFLPMNFQHLSKKTGAGLWSPLPHSRETITP
jgi:hypothetical protein